MFDTYFPKKDEIEKKWYVVDASGKILGRLASEVAKILRGKHKPTYTPHMDNGDYVIILNADQIVIKGNNKAIAKEYFSHSGYVGNEKSISYKEMFEKLNTAIHQFSKRQMTWFRRMERKGTKIHWLEADDSLDDNVQKVVNLLKL